MDKEQEEIIEERKRMEEQYGSSLFPICGFAMMKRIREKSKNKGKEQ